MRFRPAAVYRNLGLVIGVFFIFYLGKSIIGYDDGKHISHPKNPKHLYITVDKNRIDHRFDKLSPKRILVWNSIFGSHVDNKVMLECPGLSDRCIIDSNRSRLGLVDAVIIHAPNIDEGLPPAEMRKPSQRYVFMTMEVPDNIPKISIPKHYFNWSMSHLHSSDVLFKYGGFWLTSKEAELRGFKIGDYFIPEKTLRKSKSGIFGLVSNCATSSKREWALKKLSTYMNVTIGGKCAWDEKMKEICPKGQKCDSIFAEYPFFLAAENTVCEDYVTEKYWERNLFPSIPIVLRRSAYSNVNLPRQSVIAFDDFGSPKEMAEHLMSLERNFTAYAEYFKWRNGGWTLAPWNTAGFRNGYCKLCEKLWDEEQPESTIEDIYAWFQAESRCENGDWATEWIQGGSS
ncbi:unnamed protein product, partial [Mesorhabditis belari]|uniref:Fucosyltransferase n=1 Tax=Mesorhabditis belari TaxID=2138241 RepID=A0AAF3EZK9_9BILA